MPGMTRSPGPTVTAGGWRRLLPRRRQMLLGLLVAFLATVVLVGIGYARTGIPNANEVATAQATTLYYSDGKTVLARLGQTTRIAVPLKRVPADVQHAVLAAEDRHFYSESGVSPSGILRALWTDLRGGEISQGGSTITQQYVKNAYLSSERTFTRKFKEIFIAVKLANSRSKSEILQDYLNTIYFGRGAYGIQAAAKAYFHRDVRKLDAAQGAVLAALISNPAGYEPIAHPQAAHDRWTYVVRGMVDQHWLTPDEAGKLTYPDVKKHAPQGGSTCTGEVGFICQAVQLELAKDGFDQARLDAGGYRVVTTIDKDAQDAAQQAMRDHGGEFQKHGPDKGREAALVSVEPGDGAIRAMYGGSTFCPAEHRHPDSCTDLSGVSGYFGAGDYIRPPGSSFKPYTLITALQEDIGLNSVFHGPPQIEVNGDTIHNSEGESCSSCTLLRALAESINTIFVPLAQRVGPDKVVQNAYDAGIPKARKLGAFPGISLGPDSVSPLDQAVGYATIAAQGKRAEPYLVAEVETQQHDVVYSAKQKTAAGVRRRRHGRHDVCDDEGVRLRHARHGLRTVAVRPAGGRQDRHQRRATRQPGRLVHRLHPAAVDRCLVRQRRSPPARHRQRRVRLRQRPARTDVAADDERRAAGQAGARLPAAGTRRPRGGQRVAVPDADRDGVHLAVPQRVAERVAVALAQPGLSARAAEQLTEQLTLAVTQPVTQPVAQPVGEREAAAVDQAGLGQPSGGVESDALTGPARCRGRAHRR